MKSYERLIMIDNFRDRFEYLRLSSVVGVETFGHSRYLNQLLYRSTKWKKTRNKIIVRDKGCDLGIEGFEILSGLYVHHINTININDIKNDSYKIYDPNNLITTAYKTHTAIHFGDETLLENELIERTKNDTAPWLL